MCTSRATGRNRKASCAACIGEHSARHGSAAPHPTRRPDPGSGAPGADRAPGRAPATNSRNRSSRSSHPCGETSSAMKRLASSSWRVATRICQRFSSVSM